MFLEFRGLYKILLLPKKRGLTELLGYSLCSSWCWLANTPGIAALVLASWLYLKFDLWGLLGNSVLGLLGRRLLAFGSKWLLCVAPDSAQVCLPQISAALFLPWAAADSCYFCFATGTGWLSPSKTIGVMWLRSAEDLGEDKVSVFNSFTFILSTSFTQVAVRVRELLGNFFPSSHGLSLLPRYFGGL